ncbi:hypothetical protein PC121_g24828, partial [Phytophthora cactorum]
LDKSIVIRWTPKSKLPRVGYTWSTRLPPSPFHAIHQGRAQDRWRADTAPEVQQRGNYIVLTPLRRSVS